MATLDYHIHGDNIVECARSFGYIVLAMATDTEEIVGPNGTVTCPRYDICLRSGDRLSFTFLPGFGSKRWNQDILSFVRANGGRLREAADAIVTNVDGKTEKPLFAMEFCGALPAGNNAWQRQGRAFSFAHANVPYFYLAELGGYELTKDRRLKAERWPNPAVPFSYFAMTHYHGSVCLPVYETNAGARQKTLTQFNDIFGKNDFVDYIRLMLNNEPTDVPVRSLKDKCTKLVSLLASSRQKGDGLTQAQWEAARQAVENGVALTEYLSEEAVIKWKKTTSIPLTPSAFNFLQLGATISLGLTSGSLPVSYVPRHTRGHFTEMVREIYDNLSDDFAVWLALDECDLAIAWLNGFKPKGDDARPDRGLPPLARMLIGENTDLLTFVYGPAPASHWLEVGTAPGSIVEHNGLWDSILAVSDAVLLDGWTMPKTASRAYLKKSWETVFPGEVRELHVEPFVRHPGEQDVDTALHVVFESLGTDVVFEGMCNPPGGDWSGISFVWSKEGGEHRWLTLPRVTAVGAKRPDHVLSFFGLDDSTVCLCVESKEFARSLEEIGPRLIKFTQTLFDTPPNVRRAHVTQEWTLFTEEWELENALFVSMGAYIANPANPFASVKANTKLDILCGFTFSRDKEKAVAHVRALTKTGKKVLDYIVKTAGKEPCVDFIES